MKKVSAIFFIFISLLSLPNDLLAQQTEQLCFSKRIILLGFDFGTRSYCGNFGLTTNYFLTKNFNINLSGGIGAINYNGGIISIGPEYYGVISKNTFVVIGSVWTLSGHYFDLVNENQQDERTYETFSDQYIRSFAGFGFRTRGGILFKIEIGYSYALYPPKYDLTGPWTSNQISHLEKQMDSGLMVSFSFGFALSELKRE